LHKNIAFISLAASSGKRTVTVSGLASIRPSLSLAVLFFF